MDSHGDDRSVNVLFHNLKGYDGMFILQHLYRTHHKVTNQVTVGVKLLSVQSDLLTFKDSLCFLPFSLASFPSTFSLTKLKKGFFSSSSLQHPTEPGLRGSYATHGHL